MAITTLTVDAVRTPEQRARFTFIEALPEACFRAGHLPGAVRGVASELRDEVERVGLERETPVVVYCSGPSCSNSRHAAEALDALGFVDVRVFEGGKQAWTEAGLALEVPGV